MKRLLRGASALVLLALMAGFGYERWSRWAAARSFPPTGSVIEVDGGRMHLHCSGDGAPTVVLEAFGSM